MKIIFTNNASLQEKILDDEVKCDKTHREYPYLQASRTLSKNNGEKHV